MRANRWVEETEESAFASFTILYRGLRHYSTTAGTKGGNDAICCIIIIKSPSGQTRKHIRICQKYDTFYFFKAFYLIYTCKMKILVFSSGNAHLFYVVDNLFRGLFVFLLEGDESRYVFGHFGEASIEFTAATTDVLGIQADNTTISYRLHTFEEATVYLFCFSFLLVRVPENKRQFSIFSECLFEILNKSLDVHKLINFSSVCRPFYKVRIKKDKRK